MMGWRGERRGFIYFGERGGWNEGDEGRCEA